MVGLDWDKQAPEWANALISNDSGSRYYWVEQWGGSCSRFEEWESKRCKYLDEYHQVPSRINMVQPHNWILMAERKTDWNGKGNPPVGTVCEIRFGHWIDWEEAEVLCIGKKMVFVRQVTRDGQTFEGSMNINGIEFRPIKTQEQIAAEEREVSVVAMCEMTGSPRLLRRHAEELYDAGYRLTKTEE